MRSPAACRLAAGGVELLHAPSSHLRTSLVTDLWSNTSDARIADFSKAAQKDIADYGGKYVAGGYHKTASLACSEPPNRVVILQFASMDAVKERRDQGAMDLNNSVGNKYASFRILCCRNRARRSELRFSYGKPSVGHPATSVPESQICGIGCERLSCNR